MKLNDIKATSPEGIKFREMLYATIAVADIQTTLMTDIMSMCEDLNLNGLKQALDVNKEILKSFTNACGTEYSIKHGDNFDVLHKEILKFAKKSMK